MQRNLLNKNGRAQLRKQSSFLKSDTDSQTELTWIPELFGPVIETEKITLRQVIK